MIQVLSRGQGVTSYKLSLNEKVTFSHFDVQPPCFQIIMFDGDPSIQLNENIDSILLGILDFLKLEFAQLYVRSDMALAVQIGQTRARFLSITRPLGISVANYHLFEMTKSDFTPNSISPAKSYGLHDKNFLNQEIKRLGTQNVFGGEYFESFLASFSSEKKIIIDLGCGVGSLITKFAKQHSHLDFIGVDEEAMFIAEAQKQASSNLRFIESDLMNALETFIDGDVFILRFVVQHLGRDGLLKLLQKFKKHSKQGACLVIFDSDDRLFVLEPHLREADFLLEASGYAQKKHGGDRKLALSLPRMALENMLSVAHFDIEFWDSRKIPFQDLLGVLKPLFEDKPDLKYIGDKTKETFINRLKSLKNPYMRGGLVVCCLKNESFTT